MPRRRSEARVLDPGRPGAARDLVDEQALRALQQRRLLLAGLLLLLAVIGVAARYWYLQVPQYDRFVSRSNENRLRLNALPPSRGLIYDRAGVVLADNRPAYRLELVRERLDRPVDEVLNQLGELVALDADRLRGFRQRLQTRPAFSPVVLRYDLTEQEVARVAVERYRLPGVEIRPYLTRYYPFASLFTHVIGYVGRLDTDDLARVDRDNYRATRYIGKTGLEAYYEDRLHGRSGYQQVETNAAGRVVSVLREQAPVNGEPLHLSLDLALQRSAALALGDRAGAVVAVQPRTGELLAIYSAPSYDPNLFINGISRADYRALLDNPLRPLFNRALQGGYEPGSTLKPFIALTALAHRVVRSDEVFVSTGEYRLENSTRRYRDWRPGGHGRVMLGDGIVQSVNTVFYEIALRLGIDRMHDGLAQFGFGAPTGVDLHGEIAGVLPSREWKRRVHGEAWFPGETVIAGIGQGYNVVTPLQLAHATAMLVARGAVPPPHLATDVDTAAPPEALQLGGQALEREHWALVEQAMIDVVHSFSGTARAIASERYEMAGKSGTAQVFSRVEGGDLPDAEDIPRQLRDHALFIAYAPSGGETIDGRPPIAVAVVVEHGGGGSRVAAPVARAVIDNWLQRP
jgi:penicillin-binding protein 2